MWHDTRHGGAHLPAGGWVEPGEPFSEYPATKRRLRNLLEVSGRNHGDVKSVDVFVAFSVAGGTGAGIFYDYLHFISDVFDQKGLEAKIYPLVVMPSAFTATVIAT